MSSSLLTMPCPKCTAPMRTMERSGIHLETCPECRGVFLDRGELDRLIDLEAAALPTAGPVGWSEGGPLPGPGGRRDADERGRDPEWDDDDDDRRGSWSQRGPSRRRGFLGELFEGFGD